MKNLKLVIREDLCVPLETVKYLSCDVDNETVYFTSNDKLCGYNLKTLNCTWSYTLPRSEPFPEFENVTGLEAFQGEDRVCVSLDNGGVVSVDVETSTPELEVLLLDCSLQSMCWSHDQEIVLLATEHGKVIALTRTFDVIDEVDLHAEGFGAQKFLNVGWGKKETQFQGKSGKLVKGKGQEQAAVPVIDTSIDVKIVWRGDGQYFACSFLKGGQRLFRVWNRDLELQYTSEVLPGIGSCFAWKPSGSFIATTQRRENVHSLILFEMNGLKHSEFALPCGANELIVKKLQWNCDSTILMMMYENINCEDCGGIKSGIMLWTSSNYHWSLKQKLEFKSLVATVQWDSEVSGNLHVSLEGGLYRLFTWETCLAPSGSAAAKNDSSYLAVVEGSSVKLTPFAHVGIPPPMCCYKIHLQHQVRNVLFCQAPDHSNHMAVLTNNHKISLFSHDPSSFTSSDVTLEKEICIKNVISLMECYKQLELADKPQLQANKLRHLVWPVPNIMLGVVSTSDSRHDFLVRFDIARPEGNAGTVLNMEIIGDCREFALTKTEVDGRIVSLCCSSAVSQEACVVMLLLHTGCVMEYSLANHTLSPRCDEHSNPIELTSSFTNTQILSLPTRSKLFALSTHGELRCDNEVVSEECTSFAISKEFVLVTTSSHKLLSIPRQWFAESSSGGNRQSSMASKSSERALERGSTIVIHPAQLTKVVLQLPRGNLEFIHPRSLVVSKIMRLLDASRYGEAFVEMRTHRINLNLVHDHAPTKFLSEVATFVEQVLAIKDDYLNMFLADLRAEDFTRSMYKKFYEERNVLDESAKFELQEAEGKANKVDTICDALIAHLNLLPTEKILFPLVTAHVAKSSSEIKEALIVVQKVGNASNKNEDLVSKALRYLTILVDSNTLFRQSLGTYDLRLALMVAQASNDDPKEYMPFLNELNEVDENTRRYRIDMHLKLFAKALAHLARCPDKFQQCADLIKTKELYREALTIFGHDPHKCRMVCMFYSEYLCKNNRYKEAGLLLQRSCFNEMAMDCFDHSTQCWRETLNVAHRLNYEKPVFERLAKKLAVKLTEENKFLEAAEVYQFHLSSPAEAVNNLVNGSHWDRAVSLIYGHNLLDMIESCLKPTLVDRGSGLSDNLLSSQQNLKRYKHRLMIVRENKLKAAEDVLLYGSGAGDFDSSDIASDFGTVTTASSRSRYSTMSSQATTSRRRRKLEKKRFSLKPGSRFEEEGLLNVLHELYRSTEKVSENISALLSNLTLHGLDGEGKELQKSAKSTIDEFKSSVSVIWPISPPEGEGETGFGQHPLMKMCSSAETLEDVRVFLPPKLNFAKFEMHLNSL